MPILVVWPDLLAVFTSDPSRAVALVVGTAWVVFWLRDILKDSRAKDGLMWRAWSSIIPNRRHP